jgi:hypothetical protein
LSWCSGAGRRREAEWRWVELLLIIFVLVAGLALWFHLEEALIVVTLVRRFGSAW